MKTTPHRTPFLSIVSAVALCLSLAIPAVAAVKQGGTVGSSSINQANKLEAAIAAASATMNANPGQYAKWVITVNTCDVQTLPAVINAPAPLEIVGCGDQPAGPGTDPTLARTRLSSKNPSIINSPVELRGFSWRSTGNVFLKVRSSFTAKHNRIQDIRPGAFHIVGEIPERDTPVSLVISQNYVDKGTLLTGNTEGANIQVTGNWAELMSTPFVVLAPMSKPEPKVQHPVRIANNQVINKIQPGGRHSIYIGRGSVTVEDNTIDVQNPMNPDVIAIEIVNDPGMESKGIEIKRNKIHQNAMGLNVIGIANWAGTPLSPGAVTISENVFDNIGYVLPIAMPVAPRNTISPKEAFDASQGNVWNRVDVTNVQAITTGTPTEKKVTRLAGEARFETAVEISKATSDTANAVILARHDVSADALSGAPLAKALNAPILLTPPNMLHPAVAPELRRLLGASGKVYLLGGTVALNDSVEEAVKALGYTTERIQGPNRAATAVGVAERLLKERSLSGRDLVKRILVVDGTNWKEALIASPAAAANDGVVLLTNGSQMAPESNQFLRNNIAIPVTTIGKVASSLGLGPDKVDTEDPTQLGIDVAIKLIPTAKTIGIATTADFADSLAGGAHLGRTKGAMILIGDTVPESVKNHIATAATVTDIYVYGGPSRISDANMNLLLTH